jgi:hypothetical protein
MQHIEVKQLLHCILNILNTGITKLNNLVAIGADKVIVLFKPE